MHIAKMEARTSIFVLLVLCGAWQAHAQTATCTAAGRIADAGDTTCQNYTLCVLDATTSTFVAYTYTCPSTSVFNPTTARCASPTTYTCPATATTTPSTTATSVCTAEGFIADPASTNCTSYIGCVQIDGAFTETSYTCPDGTLYDPTTTLCDSNYNCTVAAATFTCTAAGRFANSADTTCQTYYLCVLATNGTLTSFQYTCPSTSVFSPTTRLCTSTYTCPTA